MYVQGMVGDISLFNQGFQTLFIMLLILPKVFICALPKQREHLREKYVKAVNILTNSYNVLSLSR